MADDPERLDEFLAFSERLADAARAVIVPHFRADHAIEDKPTASIAEQPVTRADRDAEQAIRDLIIETYPEHGILGEELGEHNPGADYTWVIDPIDGTRAFIAGFTVFGTLIALSHRGTPIIGVLDQPVLKERFVGSARGATLNGAPIHARACPRLDQAVWALTDPRMMDTPARRAVYERLLRETRFPQFGGNCYAYAMLAAGVIDVVTESDLKPWDVAALAPIVEGAGGVITGWDGGPAADSGDLLACGDAALHEELLPLFKGAA